MYNHKSVLLIAICLGAVILSTPLGQSQESDLHIEKIATINYTSHLSDALWNNVTQLSEVGPSQTFFYLIRVTNNGNISAQDVSIRDWLPYEVSDVAALEPDNGVLIQGNLVQVDLPEIGPGASGYIAIKAVSPQLAPATLYNYVYLTGDDLVDSASNRCSLTIYVRLNSYTKQDSIASFEDLLRSQSDLLAGFEDLLQIVPADQKECYQFISSYEQLLRSQTVLFSRFRELLVNSSGLCWSEDLLAGDQIAFLSSYEDLLRREACLYSGFEQRLNQSWSLLGREYRYDPDGPGGLPEHNITAQRELLASFEDLLRRQAALYDGFQGLERCLDSNVSYDHQVIFLASYEDLLRRESNLLMSFEGLIMRLFLSA